MSTGELDTSLSEESYLGREAVEQAGIGTSFLVLSNRIEFVGVYYGPAMATLGFKGLSIDEFGGYDSTFAGAKRTYRLNIAHDFHREMQVDGVKPLLAIPTIANVAELAPAEFTATLIPEIIAAGRRLMEDSSLPRRLDEHELSQRVELFENIEAGLQSGRLFIDSTNGSVDISDLSTI